MVLKFEHLKIVLHCWIQLAKVDFDSKYYLKERFGLIRHIEMTAFTQTAYIVFERDTTCVSFAITNISSPQTKQTVLIVFSIIH